MSVFSLCQGEKGGPQDIELALNEKLMLMAHKEEEQSLPVCLNDPRPCGPHLLHLKIQGQRPSVRTCSAASHFDETWKPTEMPEVRRCGHREQLSQNPVSGVSNLLTSV